MSSYVTHFLQQIAGGIKVAPQPATIEAGSVQADAQAAALGAGTAVSVFVQNPAGNASPVYIGDDASQPITVPPGGTVTLPAGDLSAIYVRADEAQTVAFIAQRS